MRSEIKGVVGLVILFGGIAFGISFIAYSLIVGLIIIGCAVSAAVFLDRGLPGGSMNKFATHKQRMEARENSEVEVIVVTPDPESKSEKEYVEEKLGEFGYMTNYNSYGVLEIHGGVFNTKKGELELDSQSEQDWVLTGDENNISELRQLAEELGTYFQKSIQVRVHPNWEV